MIIFISCIFSNFPKYARIYVASVENIFGTLPAELCCSYVQKRERFIAFKVHRCSRGVLTTKVHIGSDL